MTSPSPKSTAKNRRRFTKLVRRAHMYTGLLLLPWVILFGLSGMFFNHGRQFGPMQTVAQWTPDQVAAAHGFSPADARSLAEELVADLNNSADGERFVLPDDHAPTLEGTYSYQANSERGRLQVSISSNRGEAHILQLPGGKPHDSPPFARPSAEVASFDAGSAEQLAAALLAEADVQTSGPLEASSRGFAELRLQVETPRDGRRWNVVYKLLDGSLSGRAVDEVADNDFYSVVTRLHKTHHYPDRRGARWVWTAFADATGITMVFWGLSGLIMWWQMKPTRVVGIAGLSVAAEPWPTTSLGPLARPANPTPQRLPLLRPESSLRPIHATLNRRRCALRSTASPAPAAAAPATLCRKINKPFPDHRSLFSFSTNKPT